MNTIEERVMLLERSARRWRTATVLLVATLGGVLVVGAADSASSPRRLEARRIDIVGADGKPRIILTGGEGTAGPGISIAGEPIAAGMSGNMSAITPRAIVVAHHRGPQVVMGAGERGAVVEVFRTHRSGERPEPFPLSTVAKIRAAGGRNPAVRLEASADGNGWVTTHHAEAGNPSGSVGGVDGLGQVKTFAAKRRELVSLTATRDGRTGAVSLSNGRGGRAVTLEVQPSGSGLIGIWGADGRARTLVP